MVMTDKINPNEKHYKSFSFEVKEIQEDDSEFFTFEGYASTFGNIDLGDDIVEKGAFSESLLKNPSVPVLWQHDMAMPIGKSIEMREDERGLFVKARLPKGDDFVKGRVMPQMKVGSIQEMSIGFFIKGASYDREKEIRTLEKIDLFEFSLVTKAMNPQARISGFKSFKELEIKSLKDIETFLKDCGFSNKESLTLISKIKEFSNQSDSVKKSDELQCDIGSLTQELKNINQLLTIKNNLTKCQ